MRASRGQGGFTLIESVISVALVAIVILGLAAGLLTTVRSSAAARETQEIDAALSAYAESRKGAYPETAAISDVCPTASEFEAVNPPTLPFGAVPAVTAVETWDGTTQTWGACPGSVDPGLHRLSVEVQTFLADGATVADTATAQVVVRRPSP